MQATDFRGAGGACIRKTRREEAQGSHVRRAHGQKHTAGGRREETAHVSGQDGRRRKPCAP